MVFFSTWTFSFSIISIKSVAQVRTQLNLVLWNVLFLVVCRKLFLEKMVCSRTKFQKYVKNRQPSFRHCTQQGMENLIEVLMLQLDREEQSFLIKTKQIWPKNILFRWSYGTFIESTSIQTGFTVNFYFLWSIFLSL